MSVTAFIVLAFSSLFVIVEPFGAIPAFLAMTPRDALDDRVRMARLACWVAAGILIFFAVTGMAVFRLFGITLPAFQIAGSLLLLLISHDMLRAQRSRVKETAEENEAGTAKEDIAIAPLGTPMLAGPGAITTTVLLRSKATGPVEVVLLLVCIAAVCYLSFLVLKFAARGSQWLGTIAMRLITRLMGLLLAAIAVQFILNALKDLHAL
jgi:multiple antibiotic resistance protein